MNSEDVSMVSELGELGTAELEGDLYRLLSAYSVSSMTPEEQTVFMLEFGRLAHDRYAKLLSEIPSDFSGAIPPFTQNVKDLISEMIELRV